MKMENSSEFQFESLTSIVEPTFWHALGNLKLETLRLDESPISVSGTLSPGSEVTNVNGITTQLPATFTLDGLALDPKRTWY
jgi:ubiquitin-like modifier-activating enzyme ATG7